MNTTWMTLGVLLACATAHANGATTTNNGLQVTVSDHSSPRVGPNESAYRSTVRSSYAVKLPSSSPMATAQKLRMYVGVDTKLSGSAGTQKGPTVSGWVDLVRNAKTGAMEGKSTLSFVRSEFFADDQATRRAVAVTDGTHWYSNYGNNIDIATPTIK